MKKFADTLRSKTRVLITTHIQPDGDGIGSEMALFRALKKMGKEAFVVNPSPTPEKFEILDPENLIQVFDGSSQLPKVDAVVILDTNEVKMLAQMASPVLSLAVPILFIDHHVKELQDVSEHLIDESVGSSGELVYRYLESEGVEIGLDIATALYVAIVTDTGNFRYQRTSSKTHEIASTLLKNGVRPEAVFQSIYGKDSPQKLRLLGETLRNLQLSHDEKIAWVTITKESRTKQLATIEDTESFIGHLTLLKGVRIAALFREEDDGTTKLSLRGIHNQPVIEVAKAFGGGGHRFAAGAKIKKPLGEAVKEVLIEASSKLLSDD